MQAEVNKVAERGVGYMEDHEAEYGELYEWLDGMAFEGPEFWKLEDF